MRTRPRATCISRRPREDFWRRHSSRELCGRFGFADECRCRLAGLRALWPQRVAAPNGSCRRIELREGGVVGARVQRSFVNRDEFQTPVGRPLDSPNGRTPPVLRPRNPSLARFEFRGADPCAGTGVATACQRRTRASRRADRKWQDARRVLGVDRSARSSCGAGRSGCARSLHLAAQGAGLRHRAEPACSACGDCGGS